MQISANGKTTSLGDHDTEEEAARAFDRAAINKDGCRARTNFPVDQYETEIDDLQSKRPPSTFHILHRATRGVGCLPILLCTSYKGGHALACIRRWPFLLPLHAILCGG